MAAGIVDILKNKIKENAEELEKYEVLTEETRNKYNAEKKQREETEAEVNAMNRKIKLLEDNMKRNEDRLDLMTGKSQTAEDRLHESEDRRCVKTLIRRDYWNQLSSPVISVSSRWGSTFYDIGGT